MIKLVCPEQSVGRNSLSAWALSATTDPVDGCQKSLWAQLANKRPGLLSCAGPDLVDSHINAAGAPFNLLPSSLKTFSLTSPVNSRVVPPGGSGICFACTCSTQLYNISTYMQRNVSSVYMDKRVASVYRHIKGRIS